MKKSVVIVAGVIVLLALLLAAFLLFTPERGIYAQPGAAISKQELESADLAKIATRGLRDRGIETKMRHGEAGRNISRRLVPGGAGSQERARDERTSVQGTQPFEDRGGCHQCL